MKQSILPQLVNRLYFEDLEVHYDLGQQAIRLYLQEPKHKMVASPLFTKMGEKEPLAKYNTLKRRFQLGDQTYGKEPEHVIENNIYKPFISD